MALSTATITIGALAYSLLSTPVYQASTRLFVSTCSANWASQACQSTQYSRERVVSYAKLITGEPLAARAIKKLGLEIAPRELASKVAATAPAETVLIDVSVKDSSAANARDLVNALSDEFVEMATELETPTDGGEPAVRVIVEKRASTPESPISPRTNRNLALGLLVGLLAGIGLAILRDRFDQTLTERRVLEDLTDTPVIGAIPFDKERQEHAAIDFTSSVSAEAEAYRDLRTNLKFLQVDRPPRVIAVTSSLPAEGKSTTAINLAAVLVENGHAVCLVEADLRKPRASKYLGMVGESGLSSVLSGQAGLADVLQPVVREKFYLLSCGPIPPNPSELLGSEAATRVFDMLRTSFDFVIIDTPPVLPVTDARLISKVADGALLGVRYGVTKRDAVEQAVASLRSVGATVLGTLFTLTPKRTRGNYAYAGYYEAEPSPIAEGSRKHRAS